MSKTEQGHFEDIIKNCYLKILNREPDEYGFHHYLNLLLNGKIKIEELEGIFKDSQEYKLNKIVQKTKER